MGKVTQKQAYVWQWVNRELLNHPSFHRALRMTGELVEGRRQRLGDRHLQTGTSQSILDYSTSFGLKNECLLLS